MYFDIRKVYGGVRLNPTFNIAIAYTTCMYLDISKVYGGVRLKPVHSAISLYILCILISAKSMVGLDSIQHLISLLHTMYLDISKVYGGVRLQSVLSAISLYTVYFHSCSWILVYYAWRVVSRRKSDITFYCSLSITGCSPVVFVNAEFYILQKKITIRASRPGSCYYLSSGWTASNCFQT